MNSLSWLLYAANTLENVGTFLVLVTVALLAGYVISYGVRCIVADANNRDAPEFSRKTIYVGFAIGAAACFIPPAKTVYMIAASEVGSRVADTAEGKELLDLLRARVREALTEEKKS